MLLNKICCVDDDELGWDPDDWIGMWNKIESVIWFCR
jgi:hypothetical protein